MLELCQYGVPQASVLGPILFLLFINDIHKSLNNIVIKLFADDTNCVWGFFVITFQKDWQKQNFKKKLQKRINANNLTINYDPKKSSCCIFKPRNKCFPPNYRRGLKIDTNTLKFKETAKYLVLLLDSKLTWENHIQELNKKLVKYTCIFSKVRHYLPITCRKTV